MRHPDLLSAERSLVLVVDIQDAFAKSIKDLDRVIERSSVLIKAARLLDVPVVVTEQYPQGLGETVAPLREALGETARLAKVTFSCLQDEAVVAAVRATGRSQLVLVGIETHVCIAQTALDALALGLTPYLVLDALASRRRPDAEAALTRLTRHGIAATTVEAAIMEMTRTAKHAAFKDIARLIR